MEKERRGEKASTDYILECEETQLIWAQLNTHRERILGKARTFMENPITWIGTTMNIADFFFFHSASG